MKPPTLTFVHAGRERTLVKHPRVQQAVRTGALTVAQAAASIWFLRAKLAGMAKEKSFPLEVANQKAIAAARDLLNGHQSNRALFSQWLAERDELRRPAACVGEIIPIYRAKSRCDERVINNNVAAFYLVLQRARNPSWKRGVGQAAFEARYDDIGRLDALSLTEITKALAVDFQDALLRAAGTDELAKERATTNANSLLRQARSIFADRPRNNVLAHYTAAGLKLPECIHGFKKAPLLPEPDHSFDPPSPELVERLRTAAVGLRETDRNSYRIYLLAAGCGLRKKEIAWLCGSHISHRARPDGTLHIIELRTRAHFRTKSRKPRYVPMEDFIWRELIALDPLLAAPRSADPVTPLEDYLLEGDSRERYQTAFRRFGAWMTAQGWNRPKKAHELRKLWSSTWAEARGSEFARKLAGNTAKVFDDHYYAMLKDPELKILG